MLLKWTFTQNIYLFEQDARTCVEELLSFLTQATQLAFVWLGGRLSGEFLLCTVLLIEEDTVV